jgi:hypothetical protein
MDDKSDSRGFGARGDLDSLGATAEHLDRDRERAHRELVSEA